jgi:hypothetical protein
MNRSFYLCGLTALCSLTASAKEKASGSLNFVILLADDLGYGGYRLFREQNDQHPNLPHSLQLKMTATTNKKAGEIPRLFCL